MPLTFAGNDVLIGVDIGGTNIAAAALTPDGQLLARSGCPTLPERGPEDGLRRLLALIREVQQQSGRSHLLGVGVGCTGPLDRVRGRVQNPYTLPTWDDVPLTEQLSETLGVPVILENDAHVAALGEYWLGAGQGKQHMIYLTIGTGVGGGIIANGRLLTGATGLAGEVGHQQVDPAGPDCYCGSNGCVESLAAAPGLIRQAQENSGLARSLIFKLAGGDPELITAEIIANAARQGDALAAAIIEHAAKALGMGLRNLVLAIAPDRIVLGGGVMRSFDLFLPAVDKAVRGLSPYIPTDDLQILPAQLGLNAGVSGAVRALIDRCFSDE